MKFLRALLILIVILVVVIALLTMVAPTKMSIARSTVINAPREVVFKHIASQHNLHQWYPWDRKDSNIVITYEGSEGAIGETSKWQSKVVGNGSQTITAIDPNNRVVTHLHLWMNSEADGVFNLTDTTGGTKVTWQFDGAMPRPWNIMLLFMNTDAMVGKDFDAGLNNLKEISERDAASVATTATTYNINEMDMPAKIFVGKRETVAIPDIGKFFGDNLSKIGADVQKAQLEVTGPPSGIFYTFDTVTMKSDMAAAFPVKEVKSPPAGWQVINIPPGKAFVVDYFGDYKKADAVYNQLGTYANQKSMKMKWAIEEYVNDPMTEKDTAKWETKIYYYAE